MFIFFVQVILVLSLGGIFFLAVRKIPVLLALPEMEQESETPKKRKVLLEMVKDLSRYRPKEIFNRENSRTQSSSEVTEEKATRPEEFEQNPNYWQKVKGK